MSGYRRSRRCCPVLDIIRTIQQVPFHFPNLEHNRLQQVEKSLEKGCQSDTFMDDYVLYNVN